MTPSNRGPASLRTRRNASISRDVGRFATSPSAAAERTLPPPGAPLKSGWRSAVARRRPADEALGEGGGGRGQLGPEPHYLAAELIGRQDGKVAPARLRGAREPHPAHVPGACPPATRPSRQCWGPIPTAESRGMAAGRSSHHRRTAAVVMWPYGPRVWVWVVGECEEAT